MSAARDDADGSVLRLHGGAVPGYVARLGLEPVQLASRTRGSDALEGVAADKVALVQLHRPPQARLIRIHGLVHVVAPQPERRLQPGCIAGAQAGRQHARRLAMAQDGVPCLGNPLAADEQLEAVLARVSGAGDEGVDPGHVAVPESKVGDRIESVARQQLLRAWSLKGNQPELERAVLDLHVARRVLAKPPEVGLAVGRVHDNEITLVASVHDEAGHDSAGLLPRRWLRTPSAPRSTPAFPLSRSMSLRDAVRGRRGAPPSRNRWPH